MNSRLRFRQYKDNDDKKNMSYVLLLSKTVPKLRAFTIAMWLLIPNVTDPATVLSYRVSLILLALGGVNIVLI